MTFIRPELTELIWRAREVIWASLVVALGLWLIVLGGYLLIPLGLIVGGIGLVLALTAFRRMRFQQDVAAPGIVELDEAQVGYLGPEIGGFLSLQELVELRMLTLRGRRLWRLKQADGQALLIPVDAKGADRLYDAFANLPGMDTAALLAALGPSSLPSGAALTLAAETRVVWRSAGKGVVTRS
ncbi:MAG: hypothetical protein ABIV25_09555 [Paracoccaceae bacterium]